jgi:hypothetical protein
VIIDLGGRFKLKEFAHLSVGNREAIREIHVATLPDRPE